MICSFICLCLLHFCPVVFQMPGAKPHRSLVRETRAAKSCECIFLIHWSFSVLSLSLLPLFFYSLAYRVSPSRFSRILPSGIILALALRNFFFPSPDVLFSVAPFFLVRRKDSGELRLTLALPYGLSLAPHSLHLYNVSVNCPQSSREQVGLLNTPFFFPLPSSSSLYF